MHQAWYTEGCGVLWGEGLETGGLEASDGVSSQLPYAHPRSPQSSALPERTKDGCCLVPASMVAGTPEGTSQETEGQ